MRIPVPNSPVLFQRLTYIAGPSRASSEGGCAGTPIGFFLNLGGGGGGGSSMGGRVFGVCLLSWGPWLL